MVRLCEGECIVCSPCGESLILMRCHIFGLSQLYETLEGWRSVCGQAHNLWALRGKISFFSFLFSFASIQLSLISYHHLLSSGTKPLSNAILHSLQIQSTTLSPPPFIISPVTPCLQLHNSYSSKAYLSHPLSFVHLELKY